jgi:hypothetical protein
MLYGPTNITVYLYILLYEGELQLRAVRLRLHHFHMNHNTLQHSIAYVCSGLGYFLVHLVYYPVTPFVSLWCKIDWPFYAKPVFIIKKNGVRYIKSRSTKEALVNTCRLKMMLNNYSLEKHLEKLSAFLVGTLSLPYVATQQVSQVWLS